MPQTPSRPSFPRQAFSNPAYPPESQPPQAFGPAMPQGFPPMPPPPGSLPVMAELEWLRNAVEMQQRALKYFIDNYNGLLAKAEAEGVTTGPPSFGPIQTFAVGAIVAPGRWLVVEPGTLSVAATSGQFLQVTPTTSVSAAIGLMPVT